MAVLSRTAAEERLGRRVDETSMGADRGIISQAASADVQLWEVLFQQNVLGDTGNKEA